MGDDYVPGAAKLRNPGGGPSPFCHEASSRGGVPNQSRMAPTKPRCGGRSGIGRRLSIKYLIAFVGVIPLGVSLLLTACGGGDQARPMPAARVTGSFVLLDDIERYGVYYDKATLKHVDPPEGGPCAGQGGYSDINAGTEVRLEGDGVLIAVTRLGQGLFGPAPPRQFYGPSNNFEMPRKIECRFTFELEVEPGHRFYKVEVGRRGQYSYTYEEITLPGMVSYTLGKD